MYQPRFVKQLDGSKFASSNCNMAAGAMLVDAATLGIRRYTASQMRTASGDLSGGTTMAGVVTAIDRLAHMTLHVNDALTWVQFSANARRGHPYILHGNYARVPHTLAGSTTFDDMHSVYGQYDGSGYLIFDPLDDARREGIPQGPIYWPEHVVRDYAEGFPGIPIVAGFADLRWVNRTVAVANIRAGASRTSRIVGRLYGMSAPLLTGGTVPGENIGGNSRWWRVWYRNRFAYLHTSVARITRTEVAQ